MTQFFIVNTRTGLNPIEVPWADGSWGIDFLGDETIEVLVDLSDPEVRALDLRNTASGAYASLIVTEGESKTIKAGGPIWVSTYDRDAATLRLLAKGINSLFNHRYILPAIAETHPPRLWTVPDPEEKKDLKKTIPNPLLATNFSGYTFATIAKKLIEQAMSHTHGDLPIILPADREGLHERNYEGTDFKLVGEAINDIMAVDGGPEVGFEKRWREDGMGVEWVFRAGSQLLVRNTDTTHMWDLTLEEPQGYGLTIENDASGMSSRAWATGGKQGDKVLVARATDNTLTRVGYPMLEILDTSHSSVIIQKTLDDYARANVRASTKAQEIWGFSALANPVDDQGKATGPQLDKIWAGDFGQIKLAPFDEETQSGDVYLPQGGTFDHRILSLDYTAGDDTVSVQLAPRRAV